MTRLGNAINKIKNVHCYNYNGLEIYNIEKDVKFMARVKHNSFINKWQVRDENDQITARYNDLAELFFHEGIFLSSDDEQAILRAEIEYWHLGLRAL